jgi:hypothetical protein
MNISRSARLFQERRLFRSRLTERRPGPKIVPAANPAQYIPLHPPYPLPAVVLKQTTGNTPTAGKTQPWVWGDKEKI